MGKRQISDLSAVLLAGQGFGPGGPRSASAETQAPSGYAHSQVALNFSEAPAWQKERARRLQRLCSSIEGRLLRGQTLRQAIKQPARRYSKPRVYRCDPARRVRLSRSRLRALFYLWRKNPCAEVFHLRYAKRGHSMPLPEVQRFVSLLAAPGVTSIGLVCARMNSQRSHHTFRRLLTREQRGQLSQLFKARKRGARAELALVRLAQNIQEAVG
jgi:hypothetical protein